MKGGRTWHKKKKPLSDERVRRGQPKKKERPSRPEDEGSKRRKNLEEGAAQGGDDFKGGVFNERKKHVPPQKERF